MENKETIAVWFSCGVASAVAAKKTIDKYGQTHNILIVNNPVKNEHPDNLRFLADVEKWLGHPIISAVNENYPNADITEVFDRVKYVSGVAGAPCTRELKKEARYQFELKNKIDWHVLGFTIDEWERQKRFNTGERGNTIPVLITELLTKNDCFKIIEKAGIKLPIIYSLGYPNANCIGCVKSSSPTYWNLVRQTFPDVFEQRAIQSRRIGCKLVKINVKYLNGLNNPIAFTDKKSGSIRIYLDELPPDAKGGKIKSYECGIFCDTK